MYKIIHIHTDPKFIDETAVLESSFIENEVIILKGEGNYKGRYHETAIYLNPTWTNLNWLITLCNKADMVVLYNLCLRKAYIANRLDAHIRIAWRFFGQELYRYDIDEQYSDLSIDMLTLERRSLSEKFKRLKKRLLESRALRFLNKYRIIYDNEFERAISRIDCFLWHYRQEYDFFKKSWPDLPPFINLPTLNMPTMKTESGNSSGYDKEKLIILGNSKNPINNHFDILDMLLPAKNFNSYVVNIPFSYGEETIYSMRLKEKVKNHKNIILSEIFLSLSDYELIFKKASALVINTYRQKALGNILLALKNDVKVYLNTRNISLSILSSQDLRIYSVDQLYDDLENDNIRLSPEDVAHNAVIMRKLAQVNSIELFQQRIYDLLEKKGIKV